MTLAKNNILIALCPLNTVKLPFESNGWLIIYSTMKSKLCRKDIEIDQEHTVVSTLELSRSSVNSITIFPMLEIYQFCS